MKTSFLTIFTSVLFIIFSLSLYAQIETPKLKFKLNGKLSGTQTRQVYLKYFDYVGKTVVDTCKLKKGIFSFTGFIKDPTKATLTDITRTRSNVEGNSLMLFLEPGVMNIALVENKYHQARITGSKTQNDFEQLNKKLDPIKKIIDSLVIQNAETYDALQKPNSKQLSERLTKKLNSIDDQKNHFQHQLNNLENTFIKSHPDSYISPLLLRDKYYLPVDTLRMYYDKWSQGVKNSYDGFFLYTYIHTKQSTAIGCMAPDFKTIDINGSPLTLSAFRGNKVVLLDFWASWCSPCRALTPHLKELYQKYHSKGFEIISISSDENKDAWQKAINQDGINIWYQVPVQIHIKPFNFNPTEDDLRFKYECNSIPFQYLIDKKGKIIGRWDGGGEENKKDLDLKLAEIMNQEQ
jgi:thiol-disulfide isomerase/thioredoxin